MLDDFQNIIQYSYCKEIDELSWQSIEKELDKMIVENGDGMGPYSIIDFERLLFLENFINSWDNDDSNKERLLGKLFQIKDIIVNNYIYKKRLIQRCNLKEWEI